MTDTTRYIPVPAKVRTYTDTDYLQLARTLSEKCWRTYEGSGRECHGSLYSGGLGPCCYLRLCLATHPSSSDVTDPWAKKHPGDALLREGLAAAEAALRSASHRHSCSLLEGRASGALAIKCALLAAAGGDEEDGVRAVAEEVLRLGRGCRSPVECEEEAECEVLYGRAGYLQTLLFVRSALPPEFGDASTYGRDVVINIIQTIIQTGMDTSREYDSPLPLLWEWHGTLYLGAAHGVVGVLHTLLHFMPELRAVGERTNRDAVALVRSTLDRVDDLCFPSGNLRSSVGRERDKLVHWCHGAPGYVLLLVKAYEVFGEERYLQRAEQIARDVVYPRGLLRKGVGLCHGISGNAYVFLAVRRGKMEMERRGKVQRQEATKSGESAHPSSFLPEGEDEWLRMTRTFANYAIEHLHDLEHVPDRPYSLYEGVAGLVALLLDLAKPEDAKFPCFEF